MQGALHAQAQERGATREGTSPRTADSQGWGGLQHVRGWERVWDRRATQTAAGCHQAALDVQWSHGQLGGVLGPPWWPKWKQRKWLLGTWRPSPGSSPRGIPGAVQNGASGHGSGAQMTGAARSGVQHPALCGDKVPMPSSPLKGPASELLGLVGVSQAREGPAGSPQHDPGGWQCSDSGLAGGGDSSERRPQENGEPPRPPSPYLPSLMKEKEAGGRGCPWTPSHRSAAW